MEKISLFKNAVVIPCYNEELRLDPQAIETFCQAFPDTLLVLVNDGSEDNTLQILQKIAASRTSVVCLDLQKNSGKAEAVRMGILHTTENYQVEYIGYFDADLSAPLEYVAILQAYLDNHPHCEMVFGSRELAPQDQIKRRRRRHLAGRLVSALINITLDLPYKDTQCGAKLIRKETAAKACAQPFLSTWIFDVELIDRIRTLNPNSNLSEIIKEIPVTRWHDVGESKVSPLYFFKLLRELKKIRCKRKQ